MPFVSEAQRRKFYATPSLRKYIPEYEAATPKGLPERVHPKGGAVARSNFDKLASKLADRPVSPAVRARTATFRQPDRQGGEKNRFPMPDKKHARLALQMLPRAKNMPSGAAGQVRARAERMLGR